VKIDAAQAIWARANLGEAAVLQRDPDGAVTFQLAVRNRDAFRSFVLGFLDRATVVGPPELRLDMINWLRGLGSGVRNPSTEEGFDGFDGFVGFAGGRSPAGASVPAGGSLNEGEALYDGGEAN
jgi:WYL domain